MPLDSQLYDIMHGRDASNKDAQNASEDRFEKAIKQRIKQQVDCLVDAGLVCSTPLVSEKMQRHSTEQEILDSVDLTDFNQNLVLALSVLVKESSQYLNRSDSANLLKELEKINQNIASLELTSLTDEALYTALHMTAQGLSSILEIAIAKCNEGCLLESLALFALLTTLDSAEPNYWYRLGLVAQRTESFDLAARAYAAASAMAPEFVGAPPICQPVLDEGQSTRKSLDRACQSQDHFADDAVQRVAPVCGRFRRPTLP